MKHAMGVFALLSVLFSCDRISEQQDALRQLSGDWDKAYNAVFELVDQVETEQMDWQEQYQSIKLTDEEMSAQDEATRARMLDLREKCRLHGEAFSAIAEEVEAFVLNFENQTSQLEELETQLAEGLEIEALEEKMEYFRKILITITPRMSSWKERLKRTKADYRQSCGQYIRFVSHDVES